MRNPEERAALDEFELADEYDFSSSVRGRFYQPHKVAATLDLDDDLFLLLKKKAAEEHQDFHSMVNQILRRSVLSGQSESHK
jgi:hypothetical protein